MSKYFWKHFTAAIAILSATATLLTVFFNFEVIKSKWLYGIIGAVIVLGISFIYAFWRAHGKDRIVLNLESKLKLTICEDDLLEKKGIICIPFNEYFDTQVGGGVVGEDTLHGIFINKYFRDRIPELDEKIRNQLTQYDFDQGNRRLSNCPNKKYKLGTCINIREGVNTYVLFAFTHFDDNDTAYISRSEYSNVVLKLMEHLSSFVEDKPVYLPLFGTRMARMGRSPQRVLLHLVNTLDFNDSFTIPGGLNIVINSLKSSNINLTVLEDIVKYGIS